MSKNESITTPIEKTLRDEFAMSAVTGIMATNPAEIFVKDNAIKTGKQMNDLIAGFAYEIADAMLRARA